MFRINSPWMIMLGSVLALGLLITLLVWSPSPVRQDAPPLLVYCGAGIRAPVDAAAMQYEKEYGVPIVFQYGPSQTLVAQAEISRTGDVILPGDDTFIELAREKDLIEQSVPLARMSPVLAVSRGNPKGLRSLNDLLQPGVKLACPEPDTAATGRLVRDSLQKSGDWERVKAHATVFKATVNDVANDIKVGSVDAGFIWNSLLVQYPELEEVAISELTGIHASVSVGSLKTSIQPAAARRFMRYLAAKDRGLRWFRENGFEPVDGEVWRETP